MQYLRHISLAFLCAFAVFSFHSCKEGTDSADNNATDEDGSTVTQSISPPDLSGFKAVVHKRFAAGDTIPVASEKLEQKLPTEIAGYTLDIREANKFLTHEFAFSEATFVFYDQANDYVELTLSDYIADTLFFESPLRRYHLIGKPEFGADRVEALDGFTQQGDFGWVAYHADSRVATLFVGKDYRYALHIEATDQDDEALVKALYDKMQF